MKLRDGIIQPYEAQELKEILEIEKERAEAIDDVIAIGVLLGAVIAFLSDSKKKSKK